MFDIKQLVRKIIDEHPRSYFNILRGKKYSDIWKQIVLETKYLDEFYSDNDISRVFYFLGNYKEIVHCSNSRCVNYGKPIVKKITSFKQLENIHCNNRCTQTSKEVIEKCKKTREVNGTQQANIILKQCDKIKKKYGTDFYIQSEEFKRKAKQKMINNGYSHPMKSETIKKKIRDNYFKKHKVSHPFQNHDLYNQFHKKYVFNEICFDSMLEIAFYVWYVDKGFLIDVHPCEFEYEFEGNKHKYIPDFKVENQLIEIKGKQFLKSDGTFQNPFNHKLDGLYEAKHQCMLKNNVKIIFSDDVFMKEILQYIKQKYGTNYLRSFKRK